MAMTMAVGVMGRLDREVEQGCEGDTAGEGADRRRKGDRLFDGLERRH